MATEGNRRHKRLVGLRLHADKQAVVDAQAKSLGMSRAGYCEMAVDQALEGRAVSSLIQSMLAERDQRLFALMHEALQDNLKVAQAERDTNRQILKEAVQVSQQLEQELRRLFETPAAPPLHSSAPPPPPRIPGTRKSQT